ncbi:hypothetical protein BY458DRAFT_507821 [Sporodiniella umbellata]|nr:hypothetical protein BY458DRAFT_507821 [Sporodiniella umbellata]
MWDVLLEEYGETSTKEVPVFCKVQQSTPLHDAYESLLDEYIHNDKEKPVFCKVRLSKPLDTYLDLLSDMDENDEETPVLCTVRKTQPISYLWQTMLTEFGIQETVYQNKRKHTENGENNKRQRVSTKDLCRFINLHMCIS